MVLVLEGTYWNTERRTISALANLLSNDMQWTIFLPARRSQNGLFAFGKRTDRLEMVVVGLSCVLAMGITFI